VKGLKDGLAGKVQIVAELPYEATDPTVDSQIVNLKASGADIFYNVTTPKFAAQAIRKAAEIGWKPVHLLNSVSLGRLRAEAGGGSEHSVGISRPTTTRIRPTRSGRTMATRTGWPSWRNTIRKATRPRATVYGYTVAQSLVQVLKQAGNELRANVMKQAANLKNFELDMLLPGVKLNTSPTDFYPIEQMVMAKFNGKNFDNFGPVISGEIGSGM
jgi:branched-chain amino acid transport system substrate-binding protein